MMSRQSLNGSDQISIEGQAPSDTQETHSFTYIRLGGQPVGLVLLLSCSGNIW